MYCCTGEIGTGVSVYTGDGYEMAICKTGIKARGGRAEVLTWSSDLSHPELGDQSF